MAPRNTLVGEVNFITVMISGKWASVDNMEIRPSIQHDASPHKHAKATPKVPFPGVSGRKPYSYFSSYQMDLWLKRLPSVKRMWLHL